MRPMPPAMVRSRKAMRTITRLPRLRAKPHVAKPGRPPPRAARAGGGSCSGARIWLVVGRLLVARGRRVGRGLDPAPARGRSTCLDMVASVLAGRHGVGTLMVTPAGQG